MSLLPKPRNREDFRVAIICALSLEANYVQYLFEPVYNQKFGKAAGDNNAYTTGAIAGHNVVLAYMPSMGTVDASAVAASLAMSFTGIKLAFLVGICGVTPFKPGGGEILLGDVIISKAIVQYDFGRQYPNGFERKGTIEDQLGRASPSVRSLLSQLDTYLYRREIKDNLTKCLAAFHEIFPESKYPGAEHDRLYEPHYPHKHQGEFVCNSCNVMEQNCEKSCDEIGCEDSRLVKRERLVTFSNTPEVHFGRIGCANTVMKSAQHRDAAAKADNLIAFEMEAAGVWEKLNTVVVKAACDYSDSHKNKKWQNYAATTAAACMKAVLEVWEPAGEFVAQGIWHVPFDRSKGFFGRDSELVQLQEMLKVRHEEKINHHVVSIVGLGGMGKSRLALELAYRRQEANSNLSVLWIQATDHSTFERDILEIGKRLKVPGITDDKADIKTLVRNHLSQETASEWFMILDNADDEAIWGKGELSSDQTLTKYLPKTLNGSILVTTRTRKVATSQAGKEIIELREMRPGEAFSTFHSLLEGVTHTALDPTTSKLLEKLTYLPLAVVQAASYLNERQESVETYLELLDDAEQHVIDLLEEDFRDSTRYPESKNPVALTWFVSFEHVCKHHPLAKEYLYYMACLREKNIPLSLLPDPRSRKECVDAIGVLKGYAFIRQQTDPQNHETLYDMHRLVHVAIRNWLSKNDHLSDQTIITIKQVEAIFPWGQHRHRDMFTLYMPHVRALCNSPSGKSLEERYQLLAKIGDCFLRLGHYEDAVHIGYEVLKWRERLSADSHVDISYAQAELGVYLLHQGNLTEAGICLQKAVDGLTEALGLLHVETLRARGDLARVYSAQGQYGKAQELESQVLEKRKQVLGHEHPDTLTSMNNLASTYAEQGQYRKARNLRIHVLDSTRRAFGDEHPDTLTSKSNLASTYADHGQYEKARDLYVEVLESEKLILGDEHPETLRSMSNLAYIYIEQDEYVKAQELERHVLALRKRILGDEHPDTLTSMNNLAWTLHRMGSRRVGLRLMEDCVHKMIQVLGCEHPDTKKCVGTLNEWRGENIPIDIGKSHSHPVP